MKSDDDAQCNHRAMPLYKTFEVNSICLACSVQPIHLNNSERDTSHRVLRSAVEYTHTVRAAEHPLTTHLGYTMMIHRSSQHGTICVLGLDARDGDGAQLEPHRASSQPQHIMTDRVDWKIANWRMECVIFLGETPKKVSLWLHEFMGVCLRVLYVHRLLHHKSGFFCDL